jgi:hypothetical protein
MASRWPWLNSWESWFQSPTSSQELGSKKSPITPNYTTNGVILHLINQSGYKTHFLTII